jgi:hypothetical protein
VSHKPILPQSAFYLLAAKLTNSYHHCSLSPKLYKTMNLLKVNSLLTRFVYKNEHLCFQILIQNEEEVEVHGEYVDYSEYRSAFDALQTRFQSVKPMRVVPDTLKQTEKKPYVKVA